KWEENMTHEETSLYYSIDRLIRTEIWAAGGIRSSPEFLHRLGEGYLEDFGFNGFLRQRTSNNPTHQPSTPVPAPAPAPAPAAPVPENSHHELKANLKHAFDVDLYELQKAIWNMTQDRKDRLEIAFGKQFHRRVVSWDNIPVIQDLVLRVSKKGMELIV
ncbi:hypothetical protein E4U60_000422, partial [Claviceps pazoutovae]